MPCGKRPKAMSDRANRLGDEIAQLRRQLAELQASQARLEQTEEQLRFMHFSIEHAPEGAFWVGPDARFLYVNDTACRTLGYSREELLSMTLRDIDPYFSAEAWPEKWQLTQQGGTLTFESRHRTKDGKLIPVEMEYEIIGLKGTRRLLESHATPLRNAKGEICVLAVALDATDHRRAKEALVQSEERYRELFENANDTIFTIDLQGNFTSVNNA